MHFYLTNKYYIGTYKSEQFWIKGLVDAAYIDNGIIVLSGSNILIHSKLIVVNTINVSSFEYVLGETIFTSMYQCAFNVKINV